MAWRSRIEEDAEGVANGIVDRRWGEKEKIKEKRRN